MQVVPGAKLELHGLRPAVMWARLRQTVEPGAYSIFLQGTVDWLEGDEVQVMKTGPDSFSERRRIFATRQVPAVGGGFDTEVPHARSKTASLHFTAIQVM